jgi:hypothetical protein
MLFVLCVVHYGTLLATVIHVPGDYPTIQAGINAANPGDTVQVAPGVYYENVDMAEGVNLFGSGWDQTVVDGGGITDVIRAWYDITNYVIDGFEVRNSNQGGSTPGNVGIFLNPSSSSGTKIVRNCYVHNNGHGIQVWNDFGGSTTVENCIISNNIYNGFDPYLGTTYLTNNTIFGNGQDGYHDWSGGGVVYIENNIFAENDRYGIFKHRDTPVFISYNDVWNNGEGAYYQGYSGDPVPFIPDPGTGEISEDPQFLDSEGGDFYLRWRSACIDAGRPDLLDPDGTRSDMGALYFDQSVAGVVEMYPHDSPITIPPDGGTFVYDGGVFNFSGFPVTVDIWTMAELPNGSHVGPFRLVMDRNIGPYGGFFMYDIDRNVPGGAPPGRYKYIAYIGEYNTSVVDSTYFAFEKAE